MSPDLYEPAMNDVLDTLLVNLEQFTYFAKNALYIAGGVLGASALAAGLCSFDDENVPEARKEYQL